jgi:hypothetical protein
MGWDVCLCGTSAANGSLSISQTIHGRMWSSGGMILTGENQMSRREMSPSASLWTVNSVWTALEANMGLRGKKLTTNGLMLYCISRKRMLPNSTYRNSIPWWIAQIIIDLCITAYLFKRGISNKFPTEWLTYLTQRQLFKTNALLRNI